MLGKKKKEKSSIDLKEEYLRVRHQEILGYEEELTNFLNERNIDLVAEMIVKDGGAPSFFIKIIDKQ